VSLPEDSAVVALAGAKAVLLQLPGRLIQEVVVVLDKTVRNLEVRVLLLLNIQYLLA
jgi:diphthamide synthase subunit DPH2